jgi:hypothetical protein
MKIAVLSSAAVSIMYVANLVERGHSITHGLSGPVDLGVKALIDDDIDGVLLLSEDDEFQEMAASFTRATGRPVWRDLTEIPRL